MERLKPPYSQNVDGTMSEARQGKPTSIVIFGRPNQIPFWDFNHAEVTSLCVHIEY